MVSGTVLALGCVSLHLFVGRRASRGSSSVPCLSLHFDSQSRGRLGVCRERDAGGLAWSLVRSGYVSFTAYVRRELGHEVSRARRGEFHPIIFGDLVRVMGSSARCGLGRGKGTPDEDVCKILDELSL